jgi:hypothetical protein
MRYGFLRLPYAGTQPRQRPQARRAGFIPNRHTITNLIVVAAAMLDSELWGGSFTFDQLVKKMRDLLGPDRSLDIEAVEAVLPDMGFCLAKSFGGWRWRGHGQGLGAP